MLLSITLSVFLQQTLEYTKEASSGVCVGGEKYIHVQEQIPEVLGKGNCLWMA